MGSVDGALRMGEGARGLAVAAFAVWGTRDSGGSAIDEAAAHDVSPIPESSMVSIGSEVPVSAPR